MATGVGLRQISLTQLNLLTQKPSVWCKQLVRIFNGGYGAKVIAVQNSQGCNAFFSHFWVKNRKNIFY